MLVDKKIDVAKSEPVQLIQTGAEWITTRSGGLNRYIEGLTLGLSELGVEQNVLVMGDRTFEANGGFTVQAVARPQDSILERWRAMSQGFAALPGPNAVATHFALYAYPLRKKLIDIPHIVHFHGPWAAESLVEGSGGIRAGLKRYVEKAVYATGDRYITLSNAFADILSSRYGVDRSLIRVIPGGVNTERFRSDYSRAEARKCLGWDADRPIVLCVRRLVHRMGLEQLIEAMGSAHRAHPEAQLLIAGKGPLEVELQEAIQQRRLAHCVKLLGFVSDDDLPFAYRAANLSIVPSQSLEGFGLIIAESLASGTPALVTPVGGMPEVVRDLEPGLILRGRSVEALTQGISKALSGELSLPTDQECNAYAIQRFAWPVVTRQVLDVYEEAMGLYE